MNDCPSEGYEIAGIHRSEKEGGNIAGKKHNIKHSPRRNNHQCKPQNCSEPFSTPSLHTAPEPLLLLSVSRVLGGHCIIPREYLWIPSVSAALHCM